MRLFKLALTIALAMFIIDGAVAYGQDTFNSATTGYWDDSDSWTCVGSCSGTFPETGDTANVIDGDVITLRDTEQCAVLYINDGEVDTGAYVLTITDPGGLTINGGELLDVSGSGGVTLAASSSGGTHTVNGTIELDVSGSDLTITTYSTTISGTGEIKGQHDSAVISIADSITLTNSLTTTGITGHLQVTGAGSFVNAGIVNANVAGVLLITVSTVDDSNGDDRWKATLANAELDFSSSITTLGPMEGEFVITAGEIELNKALTTTGRLDIAGGTFDVNESVTMGSQALSHFLSHTGGTIDVAYAKTFTHY